MFFLGFAILVVLCNVICIVLIEHFKMKQFFLAVCPI